MKISLNKKKLTDIAFIVPSLAGVSIFVLIPFIDVLRRSFTNVSGTQFVFFSNYITIFQNAAFRLAFSNTIKFMVICIPILMIFSLLIAVFLHPGSQLSENGISGAHGDPGGFGCADLAAFVSSEWLFQRPSAYVWDAVTGLDGYRICLLDSCFQLRLEKSRLQCCSVDGGSDGYPGYPL